MWKQFCNAFNCLPCCAVIDDKIICMHGGLSPELSQMEQIANIQRPCDVPDTGLLCDILWSDPDPSITVSLCSVVSSNDLRLDYRELTFIMSLVLKFRVGERMIAEYHSPLEETWFVSFFVDTIWIWW
jgi:hypothetical protein